MKAKFTVQHDVLSGLKYLQVVKRKGIRVGKDEEMIVCRVRPLVQKRRDKLICAIRGHIHLTRKRNLSMRRNVRPRE